MLPVVDERQRQSEEHLTHSEDDRSLINSIVLTVFVLIVLPVVDERQRQTEEHLTHSEDDRSLHLERVHELNLVFRNLPDLLTKNTNSI